MLPPPPAPEKPHPGQQAFSLLVQSKLEATFVLLGLLILIVVQFIYGFPEAAQQMVPGLLILGVSMILLGAQATYAGQMTGWVLRPFQGVARALRVHESQVAFLLVGVLMAVLAARTIDYGPLLRAPATTIGLWLVGIGLVFLAGWQVDASRWPSRPALMFALALTFPALLIRGIATARFPPLITSDEASMGLNALAFLRGDTNNLFNIGWYSFPAFFFFLETFSIRLFGQTIEALRLFSALAGVLTVGCVFLLARAMFGNATAWLSALFLAGFHFHVYFSRLGLNNIWDGLMFVLIMGGLWVGWERGHRAYFLLAGVALGLSQYLYASTRLLFVLIPAWAIMAGIFDRERLRRALPGLFWMVALAFVIAAPLSWYYLDNAGEFFAPMRRVAISPAWLATNAEKTGIPAWYLVIQNISLSMRAFTLDNVLGFYVPNTPILRPLAGGLFLAGLAILGLQFRNSRFWLLFLWVLGFGMMVGLTQDPTAAQRFVAVAPAIALLVGFSLNELAQLLGELTPSLKKPLQTFVLIAVLLLAADDIRFYFQDYAPRAAEVVGNDLVANQLAHYLASRPAGTQVYFYGAPRMGFHSHSLMPYLAPQVAGFDVVEAPENLAPSPPARLSSSSCQNMNTSSLQFKPRTRTARCIKNVRLRASCSTGSTKGRGNG